MIVAARQRRYSLRLIVGTSYKLAPGGATGFLAGGSLLVVDDGAADKIWRVSVATN